MKRLFTGLAALAMLVGLTACGGDGHKGEHCIAHDTILMPVNYMVGKVMVTNYVYTDQCTAWAFDNPATASPGQKP